MNNTNTIFIDKKYISLLSSRLDLFKWKREGVANCRCPYCGDSQRDKTKTRGYFFQDKSKYRYKCHNCGVTRTIYGFLEDYGQDFLAEYKLELFEMSNGRKPKNSAKWQTTPKPKKKQREKLSVEERKLKSLDKISDLDSDSETVEYLQDRMIPEKFYKKLYWTDEFKSFINSMYPEKFEEPIKGEHGRIVIPFFGEDGKPFAFAGRRIDGQDDNLKYITINEHDNDLIYGLERVDFSKRYYVVEGQFDSMFLNNAIAAAGSSFNRVLNWNDDNATFIFDNQPRNKEISKIILKTIEKNNGTNNVVIWPKRLKEKDINDMVKAGYSKREIRDIINTNTFSGGKAKMKFLEWTHFSLDKLKR